MTGTKFNIYFLNMDGTCQKSNAVYFNIFNVILFLRKILKKTIHWSHTEFYILYRILITT